MNSSINLGSLRKSLSKFQGYLVHLPAVSRYVAMLAAGLMIGCCFYVMFGRLTFPYELEWMTGSILDHIERVRNGQPVYAAPTADWIPFLYPPLFYRVAALAANLGSPVVSCRLVSISCTFVSALGVWRLARGGGAGPFWSFLAVGAFFGAYSQSDFWYDIERPDSLFVALVLCGTLCLIEIGGATGAALGGLVLAISFFAKQPAVFFIAGGAAALAWRREWMRVASYSAVALLVLCLGIRHLDATSNGWFSYYALKMPGKHGITLDLLPIFAFADLPHAWVLSLSTAFIVGTFVLNRGRTRGDTIFVAMLVSSFAASMSSRLHVGGWANVLMFWTTFASSAVGVVGARLERHFDDNRRFIDRRWVAVALPIVVCAQYFAYSYVPADRIPIRKSIAMNDEVVRRVRELEARGEVLAMSHGHLTSHRHFQLAALVDVVTVEDEIPAEVARAFREKRFAALVIDGPDDLWMSVKPKLKGKFFDIIYSNYYVAERLDERLRLPVLGWPVVTSWVLLPRQNSLSESPQDPLRRRSVVEFALAEWREHELRRDATMPAAQPSTEEVGQIVLDKTFFDIVDHPKENVP